MLEKSGGICHPKYATLAYFELQTLEKQQMQEEHSDLPFCF